MLLQVRGFLYRDNLEALHGQSILGFLYSAFSHQYVIQGVADMDEVIQHHVDRFWWYELVYIMRKLFLNGIVMFFGTAEAQLIVSLLFCFLSVCLQLVRCQVSTPTFRQQWCGAWDRPLTPTKGSQTTLFRQWSWCSCS